MTLESVEPRGAAATSRWRLWWGHVEAAARAHWRLVATALVVPAIADGIDVYRRLGIVMHYRGFIRTRYELTVGLSIVVWLLLFETVRDPRRSVRAAALGAIAFTAAFGIGGQAYFKSLTNGYVNRDALMLATQMQGVIGGWMEANIVAFALALLLPSLFVVAAAIVRARWFGRRARRPTWIAGSAFVVFGAAVFAPLSLHWFDCLPPDMLLLNAVGGPLLYYAHLAPPPATLPPGEHPALPPVAQISGDAPDVVVLFGESIRADKVCSVPSPDCKESPELDKVAPDRVGFPRAFAMASCTELSSSWLFSGLDATSSIDELAHAPLVWDYAKARGYRTAYLASQHLGFQNLGIYVRSSRIDVQREARDRGPEWGPDLGSPDEITTKEALEFLQTPGPAFAVLHFSNTHDPYRQVDGFKKHEVKFSFIPAARRFAYYNSLFHHEAVVADFLRALRATPRGKRAIVVYTADHGEAWNEHDTVGHTSDMYGEQINVPLWIDAPAGSLAPGALERLRASAPTRVAPMSDTNATVVDLLGALDAPELRDRTARLTGTSLLRDSPPHRKTFLWNCPPYRTCNAPAYGVFDWPLKFQWVGKTQHYACTNVEFDPKETAELPLGVCSELRSLTFARFGAPEGAP